MKAEREKKRKKKELYSTTILFLSFSCFFVLWFSPPFAPGERHGDRDKERDPLGCVVYRTTPVALSHSVCEEDVKRKDKTSSEWRGTIKWAVENGKMAARRAMPDGGKGGSYKLQLYHEKHPHQGTQKKNRQKERKK
jgi:hypothetical protein